MGLYTIQAPRPLDNALYSQCVLAMFTLAKDSLPRIASLGRRVLTIIGIEQKMVTKSVKSSSSSFRPGEPTTPTPSLAGLARSSSWFDMNGGNLWFVSGFCVSYIVTISPDCPNPRPRTWAIA